MKTRVVIDAVICFEAEIPDREIENFKNDYNSKMFQTAWGEWHKIVESIQLPFEVNTDGSEIFAVRDITTGEYIYEE